MNKQEAIDNLKKRVEECYCVTKERLGDNIYRGHTRSISTDIEDSIALFIANLLGDKVDIYLDPSIRVAKKTHRPDLLVVKDVNAVAMIEIKANMGWCRNATAVIDKELIERHEAFCSCPELTCKFSNSGKNQDDNILPKKINYSENVKRFLISLTSNNGPKEKQAEKNKEYAKKHDVNHYMLFDGWYDELVDKDVDIFAEDLLKL